MQVRIATSLTEDAELFDALCRCWMDVANAGGPVGFPFVPVSSEQVDEAARRLARDAESGSVLIFVAEIEDELVGWVVLRLNRSKLTRHWASVQRLQSRPERRGIGIGAHLMTAVAAHAASIDIEQLHLVLRGGEGLEDFYIRLGWREIGRHRSALRLASGDRDEVSMLLEPPTSELPRDSIRQDQRGGTTS